MYNELKTLMQDRGKKKKGKSGKVVVEGETKEITPEGTSNRSKGFVIEKGPDGKEVKSRFEASSMMPEKPKKEGQPVETSNRKYKTSTGEEVSETEGYIESKNEKGEKVEEKYKASSMTPSKPKKIMLKKNK